MLNKNEVQKSISKIEVIETNVNDKKTSNYFKIYYKIVRIKILKRLRQIINNWNCKLGYPVNLNPNSFEDLTPVIVTNGNIYINSLFWALRNKNVKNIALTGSYGSGKSSILKTFKEKHPEFEYLNISLATFDDLFEKSEKPTIPPKLDQAKSDEINKKIELSILQQMLYVEKNSTIPNSRFQRIKNLKNHSIYINSLFCLATVLGYIFLFHNTLITKLSCIKYYFYESKNCEFNFKLFEFLSILLLLFGAFYIIKNFVKTINDFKFNKINLKGEVELNREVADNSILNKNIDEIIYFFERTKYNVVIIEDLDRFQEPEIFTKLREINLLINISKQVNRHIVFVYALKDEMFKNSDRTKFFDFILPIIPVINSSNSYNFLLEKLENEGINKNLLYDISLYIDDMRLLKNIINEYKIYFDKLTKETEIELIRNKLLSFIIYKNLFPKDFAILHKNEGMIYNVFTKDIKSIKEKWVNIEQQKITDNKIEIAKLEELVFSKTYIDNVKDLRKLYIAEIFKLLPNETTSFILKNETYFLNQIEDLIDDEVFNNFRSINSITYIIKVYEFRYNRINDQSNEMKINFKTIENKVDSNYNYVQRVELLNEKECKEIERLNNLNGELKVEIDKLKSYNIQELLTLNKNFEKELNMDLYKSDVLKYLIRNGFIADDYFDYISIFKEGDITRNDKNFILSIRNNKELPVDFKLNKIENLVKHLGNDFHKNEILNIDFIDYLLNNENYDNAELFNQFRTKNERTKSFIESYFKYGKATVNFIKLICKYDLEFWHHINESNLTVDEKDSILKILLMNVILSNGKSQNQEDELTNYISQKGDFFNLINFDNKNVEDNLITLKTKFENTLDVKVNKNLFDFIYKNNLYHLNEKMIEQIIVEKSTSENLKINNLKISNYTTIQESECSELIKYVNSEIENYINNVFLKLETNTQEAEKSLISLINNPNLNDEKQLYDVIKFQDVVFANIEDVINPDSWINLFALDKIAATWSNIYKYYEKYNFDEFLISFLNINENYTELGTKDIKLIKLDKPIQDNFFIDLILTNEISDLAYSSLIKNINESFDNLKIENINEDKIEMLVRKGIITLNKENIISLRQYSLSKQILLIELNFEDYINQTVNEEVDYELEDNEYELLLSSNLSSENKIQLVTEIEESNINETNNLGNLIGDILKNENSIKITYSYFINLLNNINSGDTRVKLCNIYIELFLKETSKIEEVLTILKPPFTNIIEIGLMKPPVKNNEWNFKFINNLKKGKYIISYSVKDDKITRIRRN
ncbi:hypothetical protein [Flavobacterium sp.]|uniref:YobI family P-loop NTPase n=1 Tax=Flavobacterium sp. TaxID=239 RepID=UPI003752FC05